MQYTNTYLQVIARHLGSVVEVVLLHQQGNQVSVLEHQVGLLGKGQAGTLKAQKNLRDGKGRHVCVLGEAPSRLLRIVVGEGRPGEGEVLQVAQEDAEVAVGGLGQLLERALVGLEPCRAESKANR